GGLTKSDAGILTLSNTNTYAGGTTVTGGLVNFAAAHNLGSGNITLNGGGMQWATGNTTDISSRLNALGAGGGTFDTNGNNVTLNSAIGGSGGVTKAGSGTLTLSAANGYTGGTAINGGTLSISSNANLGAAVTALSFDGGTLSNTAFVALGNRAITLNAGGGTIDASGGNVSTTGGMTGTGGLTKTGGGTLVVGGAASNYTGTTNINAGILQVDTTNNVLSSASAFTIASGASLQLGGTNQAIGSLAGGGTVENVGGLVNGVLTAGGNGGTTALRGGLPKRNTRPPRPAQTRGRQPSPTGR